MCVFIFSTTFVWNISHSKKNERDRVKNSIGLNVLSFNNTFFFLQIFEKYKNINFSWEFVQCNTRCSTRIDGRTHG